MTRQVRVILFTLLGIACIACIACIGLLSAYALNTMQRYEETVDQGPSPQARANPYLAAESFLRQRKLAVQVIQSAVNLPDTRTQPQTLLMLDSRESMTPAQAEQILRWARSGGRLLIVAEQLWNEKKGRSGDLLLDRLQIRQFLGKDIREQEPQPAQPLPDEEKTVIPLLAPTQPSVTMPWPELTRLYLENEDAPAYMSFDPDFHLEDPQDHAQSWANSGDATHLLQMVYGDGLITVVTDADLWKNTAINKYDNAWLLWYLTQDSNVTLVTNTEHDSLLSLLLRHFPMALLALALLIGLSLWRFAMRQGPLRLPATTAHRQLTEHLRASADFLVRHSGQSSLLRSLQLDIMRRARLRHPGFETLVVADQWQVLARLTRQPTSAISQALRPRPPARLSRLDFTRQVAHLQTIRNAL